MDKKLMSVVHAPTDKGVVDFYSEVSGLVRKKYNLCNLS